MEKEAKSDAIAEACKNSFVDISNVHYLPFPTFRLSHNVHVMVTENPCNIIYPQHMRRREYTYLFILLMLDCASATHTCTSLDSVRYN